jgi:uncharacterized membrane protein YhaH (DUF805 family)
MVRDAPRAALLTMRVSDFAAKQVLMLRSPPKAGVSKDAPRRGCPVADKVRCPLPEGIPFRTKSAIVSTNPQRGYDELQKILFSFDGRIGRRTYWLAVLALIVAVLVLTCAPFLLGSEQAAVLIIALTSQCIWLSSLWPILAVGSKRLHDRNKNGWWLLVFWLLPFALFTVGLSIALFDPNSGRSGDLSTASILILASLPPALWGIVELGILPGTKGPNLYGADPAQQLA